MYLLNQEYISSLLYRHRDEHGFALYLAFFGMNQTEEPFPLFTGKMTYVHEAIDRFVLHGIDLIHQNKTIIAMLSKHLWYPRTYFDYINNQLKLHLPQNFQFHVIDLGQAKPSPGWLLRQMMRACGIRHIVKEDTRNLAAFKKFIEYQYSEYKKKYYFALFRSDNLSFSQLSYLKKFNFGAPLPLVYFLLEGSADTYHHLTGLRKDSLDDYLYDIYFILHRGSYDTVSRHMQSKVTCPLSEIISPNYLRSFFIASDGHLIEPLFHSILQRMSAKKIKQLSSQADFDEIFSQLKKENDEFITKSPVYKKNLQHKDYIFPPQFLRDGPSLNEANRFFRWIGWAP